MNSKKLFKTLLWSLAGLILVLSGCTKNKKPSSPSTNNSTSSSISSPDGSSSSSSDVEDATKLVIENLAYNYDGYSSLVSVWTDKYVNSTIAPETANVSNKADGRRDVPYDECLSKFRWIFAVDANGYIVYASFGTKAGYGSPNDDFYRRENAWNKDSTTEEKRKTTFPVFRIADDWEPWPAANADHWDFVIPEGGFTVSSYLGIDDFVNLYNFITGDNKVSSQLDGKDGQAAIVAHAAGSLDNIYLYLDEDRNLVAEKLDNRTGDEEAYLFNEDGPSISFDKISDVLAGNQNEEKTIHGYVVSTFDNAFIIDDSSAASNASSPIYVYDETGTLIPKLEDAKNYPVAASNTVSVTGKYQKVNEKNIFVPTKIEVLSPYWACKEPSSFEVLDYDTQWVKENQNRKFSVKGVTVKSIDANDPNKVTFEDANNNQFVGVNLFYSDPFKVGQKFDVYGILLVENGQLVFTNEVVGDFKIYVTITVVDGTINGTDGATTGSYAVDTKITLEPVNKGENLRFTGWNKNGQPASTDRAFTTAVEGNDTYTAIFVDYSNISVRNGGTITAITDKDNVDKMSEIDITNTNGVYSAEIKIGYKVTFHADDREDYLFTGWYYVGDETNVCLSTDTDFVYTVSNSNADIEARYVTLEETPEPIPDSIKPDKFNENIAANEIVVYTDFEINGKLPDVSQFAAPGDTKAYMANNAVPRGGNESCWANTIVVDKYGKIVMMAYAPWNGNGGGYPGGDEKPYTGLTQYPGIKGKDLPFTVGPDYAPWVAGGENKHINDYDYRIPEGGFIIAVTPKEEWAKLAAKIVEDDNLLKENLDTFKNTDFVKNYSIADDIRIYLGYDNSIVIDKETANRGVVTPEYLNPETEQAGLAIFTDNWVNGTIADRYLASDTLYNREAVGRRKIKLAADGEVRHYVIGVNANGKIVYASYGTNHGYGGPSDGFYSQTGKEKDKNDMWLIGEDWIPWADNPDAREKSKHYETVIPEGGFVITARNLSDPGMLKIINELVITSGKRYTELPKDNSIFERDIAKSSLDNFTLTLSKMGKILINNENVKEEATPEVQVVPEDHEYTVYTEQGSTDGQAPIKSYIDDSRVAVIDPKYKDVTLTSSHEDKQNAKGISGNYLTIAVDSEGRIAYLVYDNGGRGAPYSHSYYRNSYYGFRGNDEDFTTIKGIAGPNSAYDVAAEDAENAVEVPVHLLKEGLTGNVNPALVVDTSKGARTQWKYYQEYQVVVPQGGFVVVANGMSAVSFIEQIYGKTLPLNGDAISSTYENKYLVSDDTRLERDAKTNVVTVKPGAPTFAYVEVTDGTLSSEDPKNIVYTNPVTNTTTTQYVVKINSQVTITPNEAPEGLQYAGIYEGTNPVASASQPTYTFEAVGSRKFSCNNVTKLMEEMDYVYEELNPTANAQPDKFTIFTDFEIQGTQSVEATNVYGNVPEGRHGVPFNYINGGDGHGVIVVNKDGYIIMAQTRYGSYGGPGDGYYVSAQKGLSKSEVDTMIFAKGDDWQVWSENDNVSCTHYDYMLPEGGFAIFASITNPTFIKLINDLTGKVYTDTLSIGDSKTTIGADGSLDKWYLSLSRTGDLRVQDRQAPQPEKEPVNVQVTVENGTIKGYDKTTVEIEKGSRVTIVANEPQQGTIFAGWYKKAEDGTETQISTDREYTFRLGEEKVSFVAKYEAESTPDNPIITVEIDKSLTLSKVNGKAPEAGHIYRAGDELLFAKDTLPTDFAGLDVNGKLITNYTNLNPAVSRRDAKYTLTKEITNVKISARTFVTTNSNGKYDVLVNVSGHDTIVSIWTQEIKESYYGRIMILVGADGKVASLYFYSSESTPAPKVPEGGFVISIAHQVSYSNTLISDMAGQSIEIGKTGDGTINNFESIQAAIMAKKETLKLGYTEKAGSGILLVAADGNLVESANVTVKNAKITKVGTEDYKDYRSLLVGETITVTPNDATNMARWEVNGVPHANDKKGDKANVPTMTTGTLTIVVEDDMTIEAVPFATTNSNKRYDVSVDIAGHGTYPTVFKTKSIELNVTETKAFRIIVKVDANGKITEALRWDGLTKIDVPADGFILTVAHQVPYASNLLSDLAGTAVQYDETEAHNWDNTANCTTITNAINANKDKIKVAVEDNILFILPVDGNVPERVTLTKTNAKLIKVNDAEYKENIALFVGDKVEFAAVTTEGKSYVKWKVNDVDFANRNKDGVMVNGGASINPVFVVSTKQLKVELLEKQTLPENQFYVTHNIDGYGSQVSIWDAGKLIKAEKNSDTASFPNAARIIFKINKATQDLAEKPYYFNDTPTEFTVAEDQYVIAAHYDPLNNDNILASLVGSVKATELGALTDANKEQYLTEIWALKDRLVFEFDGNDVLTIKIQDIIVPPVEKAEVKVEDAKILKVNGEDYVDGQQLSVGQTVTVGPAEGSTTNGEFTDFAKWQLNGKDVVARETETGVYTGDDYQYTFTIEETDNTVKYVKLSSYAADVFPLIRNLDGYNHILGVWEPGQKLVAKGGAAAGQNLSYQWRIVAIFDDDSKFVRAYWIETEKVTEYTVESGFVLTGQDKNFFPLAKKLDPDFVDYNPDDGSTVVQNRTNMFNIFKNANADYIFSVIDDTLSITLDSKREPDHITDKTVDNLYDSAPTEMTKVIYEVEGIWVATGAEDDVYGNGYLIDPVSGKKLTIHGMAPDSTPMKWDRDSLAYGNFTNPKTFQSLKGQFTTGDKIKLGLTYNTTYKNYYSYFIEKVADASEFTYNVTSQYENSQGSVVLSAKSGVYGTEVTATVTANPNYKIKSVLHNGNALVPEEDSKSYKFNIEVGPNVVAVEFQDAEAKLTKFEITAATLSLNSGSYKDNTEGVNVIYETETIKMAYLRLMTSSNYIQGNSGSFLYNIDALGAEIESITLHRNSKFTSAKSRAYVLFSTEAISTPKDSNSLPSSDSTRYVASTGSETVTCNVSGAKYFAIQVTSNALYFDKIEITYKL